MKRIIPNWISAAQDWELRKGLGEAYVNHDDEQIRNEFLHGLLMESFYDNKKKIVVGTRSHENTSI